MDNNNNTNEKKDIIAGRNAVTEALKSGRTIATIFVARGQRGGSISVIINKAKEKGITVKDVDSKKLDFMCSGAVHQGVVAQAAIKEYSTLDEAFELAKEREEEPFFIVCDELSDPQNLGAIIRTAECSGAHGIIIPKRRSVALTYAVGKASAGAYEYVPVIKVNNLASTIDELKDRGLWIYAADMDGKPWCEADFKTGGVALVIGNEGSGVQRLIRDKSDFVLSLPMCGKINSLNASVACGILCYEVMRQRKGL